MVTAKRKAQLDAAPKKGHLKMNATELFHKDGRSTGIFFCGQCRIVHRTEGEADECCAPRKCSECGKDVDRYWTVCESCRNERDAKAERERFEKANKLTDWDGWVSFGDRYFESVDALLEYCDAEDIAEPEYVWACDAKRFVHIEICDILERIGESEDAYEDFDPDQQCNGVQELEVAIDKFNEANQGILSYHPNYHNAVLIASAKAIPKTRTL